MATIRKRGNSYQIRTSQGYNVNGKQIERSMTWTPDTKMTAKQIEKELKRQTVLFEEACNNGYLTASTKFEDFAEQWFCDYASINLKTQTIRTYNALKKRVYANMGHMRLDKISIRTIQKFVSVLSGNGTANDKAGMPIPEGGLAPKTVRNYVTFISTVFDYAVKMQMIQNNPCRNVTLPKLIAKERTVYTLEEVQSMLSFFEKESEANLKYVIFFTLAAFTGLRRGELLGLEWKDIDWDNHLISVKRTSAWTKEKGIYTDTPKTNSSLRIIKVPDVIIEKLRDFRKMQNDYKASIGSKWIENDRLFNKINGEPMGLRSPYKFYEKFCKRTGLRFVNIHSFRHFNASIMILKGVDVKTVQACLGHNDATTTLKIYAHSFRKAQAMAMDSVADCILGTNNTDGQKFR